MKTNTKKLALSAILAAVSAAIVCLSAVFPSGRAALAAVAGLSGVAAVIHCGGKWAACVYAVSAALSLLLSPDKGNALLYIVFLGYYPALKSPIERIKNSTVGWILKFVLFNAAVLVCWLFLRGTLWSGMEIRFPLWILWIGANAVFALYDIGLSRLIQAYIRNISGKTKM